MGRIQIAIVTGDHSTVAEEDRNIHDSFVRQQELTDAQRKELCTELPPDFIKAEQAFTSSPRDWPDFQYTWSSPIKHSPIRLGHRLHPPTPDGP